VENPVRGGHSNAVSLLSEDFTLIKPLLSILKRLGELNVGNTV
jgi:hypothetical protein